MPAIETARESHRPSHRSSCTSGLMCLYRQCRHCVSMVASVHLVGGVLERETGSSNAWNKVSCGWPTAYQFLRQGTGKKGKEEADLTESFIIIYPDAIPPFRQPSDAGADHQVSIPACCGLCLSWLPCPGNGNTLILYLQARRISSIIWSQRVMCGGACWHLVL